MTQLATGMLVLIGGCFGAVARYLVSEWLKIPPAADAGPRMPVATLSVNLVGSFVLGLVSGLSELASAGAPGGLALAGIGFCGAFTTFSVFAVDLVALVEERAWRLLTGYLSMSLIGGFAAAALGLGVATWSG